VTWPTNPTPANSNAGRLPGGGTANHDHEITMLPDTTLSPNSPQSPEPGRLPGGGTANHDHEITMPPDTTLSPNLQHDHNGEVISESVTWPTNPTPANSNAGRLPGGGTANHDHEITMLPDTTLSPNSPQSPEPGRLPGGGTANHDHEITMPPTTTLSPEAIAFFSRCCRKRH